MGIINIFISTVLALIYPGAGQIYNGQTKKGFWFFGIGVTLWILSETIFTRLWFEMDYPPFSMWAFIDAIVVAIGIYRGKRDLSFVRNWKGFVKIAIVIVVPLCLLLAKAALAGVCFLITSSKPASPRRILPRFKRKSWSISRTNTIRSLKWFGMWSTVPVWVILVSLLVQKITNCTFVGINFQMGK